jgi:hypothetical protein
MTDWMRIEDMPEEAKYTSAYLLHGPELVHADFNPEGVERGYWQDDIGWRAPVWDSDSEEYLTLAVQPTHYAIVPAGPHSALPGVARTFVVTDYGRTRIISGRGCAVGSEIVVHRDPDEVPDKWTDWVLSHARTGRRLWPFRLERFDYALRFAGVLDAMPEFRALTPAGDKVDFGAVDPDQLREKVKVAFWDFCAGRRIECSMDLWIAAGASPSMIEDIAMGGGG